MNGTGRRRGRYLLTALALATVQTACDSGPDIGPPASMTKTGDNQSAPAGTAVPTPPAVTVLDANGRGVPGLAVVFVVTDGAGLPPTVAATTDAAGTATVGTWTLGTTAGVNTMSATTAGVPPATFTATGVHGPATTITKVSIDPTVAAVGAIIDSIAVRVADQFGNPVAGATVTFSVTSGGGAVSPTSRVTLADGRAAARWTIGPTAGTTNTVTAAHAGLPAPSVTFSTVSGQAVGSVALASTVLIVDSLATITPQVTVKDPAGNVMPNALVTLSTRETNVATVQQATVTGARSGQTFLVAASADDPNAKDSAVVVVAKIGGPVVTALIPRFDLKTDTTFTVPIVIDMRASGEKVGAATIQLTWNPAAITFVSDAEGAANAGAAVNASNAPTGSLTMALASSDGFAGAVEIRKLTFKAASTVGRLGTLSLIPIDLAGANSFTNLLPKTVGTFYPFRTR